uniref:hypothetical protein n=1 Tax=Salmonella sp. TaxID=599 RepID=UPI001CD9189D|nr:hypothetical protein [Salmonella sp.]
MLDRSNRYCHVPARLTIPSIPALAFLSAMLSCSDSLLAGFASSSRPFVKSGHKHPQVDLSGIGRFSGDCDLDEGGNS